MITRSLCIKMTNYADHIILNCNSKYRNDTTASTEHHCFSQKVILDERSCPCFVLHRLTPWNWKTVSAVSSNGSNNIYCNEKSMVKLHQSSQIDFNSPKKLCRFFSTCKRLLAISISKYSGTCSRGPNGENIRFSASRFMAYILLWHDRMIC